MLFRIDTIITAARAIWSKARWLIAGRKKLILTQDQARERIDICLKCEYLNGGQCAICTCFVIFKARFADERCPHNPPKWREK